MTFITASILGFGLLIVVDVFGALLSRFLRFHYGYLALISIALALSPAFLTDQQTSSSQAAVFSLIIYGPETFLGLFVAYKIDPYAGNLSYRDAVNQAGFARCYANGLVIWVTVACGAYLLK